MKLHKAIIAIFAFSLFMAAINQSGIFSSTMPVNDGMTGFNETVVTDLTRPTQDDDTGGSGFFDTIFAGAGFLGTSLEIIEQIVLSILNIDDVLHDYGVPDVLITVFYQMLILIAVLGLMKLVLGRGDKSIE